STLTSPYAFSQFWLNADDRDVVKYLKVFSLRSLEEIDAIAAEFNAAPHTRVAQKALAEDVTTLVNGSQAYEQAIAAASSLLRGGETAGHVTDTLRRAH